MAMLCERPGCSELSAVLYHFDAMQQRVWLESPDSPDATTTSSALCARHADALLVPRGWMLDDRREDVPRLFRPPEPQPPDRSADAAAAARTPRRGTPPDAGNDNDGDSPTQLTLDEAATVAQITERETSRPSGHEPDPDETMALPWTPVFDDDDDLDGLLDANGELLGRAFRGTDRPRRGTG